MFDEEIKSIQSDFEAKLKTVQEHVDKLDLKLQAKSKEVVEGEDVIQKAIKDNIDGIKEVRVVHHSKQSGC